MRVRPSVIESFNFAIEGVIHVLRTQRNMRLHFAAAVVVIVVAVAVGVSKIELSVLLISIAFVLVAEMINTAVEGTIDAATTSFDPMAKLVCKGAREMTNDIRMSDATFSALQNQLSAEHLNDLVITIEWD